MTLNGWAVPVVSAAASIETIGTQDRAFNGGLITDRRWLKRKYTVTTLETTQLVARAIEGLALGSGQLWHFDSHLYSTKGVGPADGSGGALGVGAGKFNGALQPNVTGTTNILEPGARRADDLAAFAYGPVPLPNLLAVSPSIFVEGHSAIRLNAQTISNWIETNPVPVASATQYTASFYVRPTTNDNFTIDIIQDVGPVISNTVVLTQDVWTRIEVTGTTDVGATTAKIRVTTAGVIQAFYVDAGQLEAQAVATPWVDGTRPAGHLLAYSSSFANDWSDYTISAWLRYPALSAGGTILDWFDIAGGASSRISILAGANSVGVLIGAEGTGFVEALTHAVAPDGAYHHIALTVRRKPETGEARKSLYYDGALVASSNVDHYPSLQYLSRLYVGHDGSGGGLWPDAIDELLIVPYAAPASLVAAWAGAAVSNPDLPRVFAGGEFTPDGDARPRAYVGSTGPGNYGGRQNQTAGEWRNNYRPTQFTLREV